MKLKHAVAATLVISAIIITGIFAAALVLREQGRKNQSAGNTPSPAQGAAETFSAEQVAAHASREDCWIIISGSVYNVTSFIATHPGGADILAAQCGKDATTGFQTQGGQGTHSQAARDQLESLKVGTLGIPANGQESPGATQNQPQQTETTALPQSVTAKYPDAAVQSDEVDGGGERKIEILTNGQCRELRLDRQSAISRDEPCNT